MFKLLEFIGTRAQGKGFGSSSLKHEIKLATKLLSRNPNLVIDIGANVGLYSEKLIEVFPDIELHLFEPSSLNYEKLKNKFKNQKNIHICSSAISNKNDKLEFFSNYPGSPLASLIRRRLDHFSVNFDFINTVETIRFEDYWTNVLGKRVIDLVKMDIEGHEFSALSGFGSAINFIRIIQFEFGGCNIDSKTFFQDFWYFFKDINFDIFRVTPLGLQKISQYSEVDECFLTTNYLAFNKSFQEK